MIGFVGLGAMGSRMARNLISSGKKLIIFDADFEKTKYFSNLNVKLASSLDELASESSTIITMLPESCHVFECFQKMAPNLSKTKKGIWIDSSTIDPFVSRKIEEMLLKKEWKFLDAPVSGGVIGAANATLTFMVGGKTSDFIRIKSTLKMMGKNIVHCGPIGSGQIAKICNNLLAGISMLGTAETFILGQKMGVDRSVLFELLRQNETQSWSTDTYCPMENSIEGIPSSRNYKDGFACELMAKDLNLAKNLALKVDAGFLLGSATNEFYKILTNNSEYKSLDFGVVYKVLNNKT